MFSVPVKIRPALPHIAVWALFLLAPFFIRVPAHATNDFSRLPVGYFVFTNLLNAGLFYANAYYLYPRYCNRKKWWLWLITVVLLTWLLFQLKIIIIQTGFPAIDIDASTWRFAYCNTRIGWLYQGKGDKIEPYAQLASTQIQQAASLAGSDNKVLADIYCVWSMAQRAYVFINPMSYGPKYGPVSAQYLEKAKKADPDNPRVLWLEGWVKYYTPKLWGGDKDKAKTFLQQALDKLKSPVMTPSFPHWGRNDCESLLAQYKS